LSTSTIATVLDLMVDRFGIGRRGTNTSASTTQITDAVNFKGAGTGDGMDAGCHVLFTGPAAEAEVGQISTLATRFVLSTGVAKLGTTLTTSLDTNSTFIILNRPLRWDGGQGVIDALNHAAQEYSWERRTVPITAVPDGDMLASAVTDWTGTNSALAKVVATTAKPERNISVTDSGAGAGYMAPAVNLFVEPGTTYYLEVTGWGTDANDSGTLQVKDVTNANAAITLTQSVIDRMEPERLVNTVAVPATCKEVQIRLVADAASDVVSWTNLIWRKADARRFILADRPQRPMDIGNLLIASTTSSDWLERGNYTEVEAKPTQLDSGLWEITTDVALGGLSVWYQEFVRPSSYTAAAVDTGTTTIPAAALAATTAKLVLEPHRARSRQHASDYTDALNWSAKYISEYKEALMVTRKVARSVQPRLTV